MSDKKRKAAATAVAEDESESVAKDTELPTNEELARLLAKKESLESSLSNLERQIYALETSYLEDTYAVGNLLRVSGILALLQPFFADRTFRAGKDIYLQEEVQVLPATRSDSRRRTDCSHSHRLLELR